MIFQLNVCKYYLSKKKNGSSSISTTTNDSGNATKGNGKGFNPINGCLFRFPLNLVEINTMSLCLLEGRKIYGRLFLLELRNHLTGRGNRPVN
jgi:hypothetical protein